MATSEAQVHDALVALQERMRAARLPLETSGAAQGRKERHDVLEQLRDYVLPRLSELDAPLLVVVGGSTGSGKSTLVNSIVGHPVTEAGALRPTTRTPVLVHNPEDAAWFEDSRILPDLPRGPRAGDGELQLVAAASVPAGVALLDTPDIDSVVVANRELAAQLLSAADMWLFITTAERYADAVPWTVLGQAEERDVAIAVVLDRTDPNAVDTVRADLAAMLTSRGLGDSPLFVVPEVALDEAGVLPGDVSEPVERWLHRLVTDEAARSGVIRRTLDGAIAGILESADTVANAAEHQVVADAGLRAIATESYTVAAEKIDEATSDASVLRGEVLARWQNFVGTGEFLRALHGGGGWARGWLDSLLRSRPQPTEDIDGAIEHGVRAVVADEANEAAERADAGWRASEAGRELLGDDELCRARDDLDRRASAAVREWQDAVRDLIRSAGSPKRVLSLGVNGVGLALMIAVLGSDAGETATVGRKLLAGIFGEGEMRQLVEQARHDLNDRMTGLLREESSRFTDRLDTLGIDERTPGEIRGAIIEVRHARSETT